MSIAGMLMYESMRRSMSGDISKYYDVPSFDDFKNSNATARPTLKAGYTRSSARMSGEGVGEMVYAQNPRKIITRKNPKVGNTYGMTSGTYIYKTPVAKPAPKPKPKPKPVKATSPSSKPKNKYQGQIASLTASIKKQQQKAAREQAAAAQRAAAARKAAQKDYQSQLSAMQNLYASNLKSTKNQFGLQISGLQSSISGLKGTISDNATAYQKNIADQANQFKGEMQTMTTNQERARLAGATPELKLQQSADQKIGGTTSFKKRLGTQFNTPTYGSLASIKSGTLNI